jgi:hypothetical protein
MYSIINNADNIVQFLDYTTLSLLGGSAVIIGQSMVARLRNEFVANYAPQPTKASQPALSEQVEVSWFRKPGVHANIAVNQGSAPTTSEISAHEKPSVNQTPIEDPWESPNQTAYRLSQKEVNMSHASNCRLLKEGALTTQDYQRMKKKKLIEIPRAKGIPGANGKKNKRELVAKLSAAS